MNRYTFFALLALAGSSHAAAPDISQVNGAIVVGAGESVGNASTVNGSIRVADRAVVAAAHTVNGRIVLGADTTVQSLSTVNGPITIGAGGRIGGAIRTVNGAIWIGPDAHVADAVTSTNGAIELGRSADVAGRLANLNGRIRLDGAHVGGGIETVSGGIDLGAGSKVEGGIWVKDYGRWGRALCGNGIWHWLWPGSCELPIDVIGPDTVVQGTLRFDHAVKLYVSTSARIGPIVGATAILYSGARPPI